MAKKSGGAKKCEKRILDEMKQAFPTCNLSINKVSYLRFKDLVMFICA